MTKHTHSWKKYKGTQYYCTGPTCYSKYDIEHLYGKLAECNSCHKHFLIYKEHISQDSLWLNCPSCSGLECELTVEDIKKSLTGMIREEVKQAIHLKLLSIAKREREVSLRELSVEKKRLSLVEWEQRLTEKRNKDTKGLEERKRKILQMIYDKRAKMEKLVKRKPKEKIITTLEGIDIGDIMLKRIEDETLRSNDSK